jgi:8-oxo-dGTP pyrophosphatase MutT (NUDIX family)
VRLGFTAGERDVVGHPDIEGITEQLARGGSRVVFFIGAGLSKELGFPLWSDLLHEMLSYGVKVGQIGDGRLVEARELVENGDYLECGSLLREELGEGRVKDYLKREFSKPLPDDLGMYEFLVRLPCAGFVTTNYDTAIESAFARQFQRPLSPIGPSNKSGLGEALHQSPFLVKIHGDAQLDEFVFDTRDYDRLRTDPAVQGFLYSLCGTHTLVFLGYGMADDDIWQPLRLLTRDFGIGTGNHVALMPNRLRSTRRKVLEDANVKVVLYPSDEHEQVGRTVIDWHLRARRQGEDERPMVETAKDCSTLLRQHQELIVPELLRLADRARAWLLETPTRWGAFPEGDPKPANIAEVLIAMHASRRGLGDPGDLSDPIAELIGFLHGGQTVSPSLHRVNIQTHALTMLALLGRQGPDAGHDHCVTEMADHLVAAAERNYPGWSRLSDADGIRVIPSLFAFRALLEVDRFPQEQWRDFRAKLMEAGTFNQDLEAVEGFSPAAGGWALWLLSALRDSPHFVSEDEELARLALVQLSDPRLRFDNENESFVGGRGSDKGLRVSWTHPSAAAVVLGGLGWVDNYQSAWEATGGAVHALLQAARPEGFFRERLAARSHDHPWLFETAYAVWALSESAQQLEGYTIPKAGLVIVDGGRLLLLRKKGKRQLILPGGTIENGESAEEAAARECVEELGVGTEELRRWKAFEDEAGFERGARVRIDAFQAKLAGDPAPHGEIAEIVWLDPRRSLYDLTPIVRNEVLPALRADGLIE